jgi:sugar phosphate isomerase/epimerase
MQVRGNDIGVCGWSLQPADSTDLVAKVKQLGLAHVQIGLRPLLAKDGSERQAEIDTLSNSNLTITATSITFPGEDYSTIDTIRRTGGFVPDEAWPQRLEMAIRAGELTAALGVKCTEFHVGFIPTSNDPTYKVLVDRAREVAVALAKVDVDLLMETGQESGSELLQFLNDLNCRNVGVNFDPANMILYDKGDPIAALRVLGPWIRQVHIKDATRTQVPGQWGAEVPTGTGEVDWRAFFATLKALKFGGDFVIEREAGNQRVEDIQAAKITVEQAAA